VVKLKNQLRPCGVMDSPVAFEATGASSSPARGIKVMGSAGSENKKFYI
jgi:hypothetical protein